MQVWYYWKDGCIFVSGLSLRQKQHFLNKCVFVPFRNTCVKDFCFSLLLVWWLVWCSIKMSWSNADNLCIHYFKCIKRMGLYTFRRKVVIQYVDKELTWHPLMKSSLCSFLKNLWSVTFLKCAHISSTWNHLNYIFNRLL